MKKCPSCKHAVSPKAETCPNCGHPIKKKTSGCAWLFLIALVGIMIMAAIGGSEGSSSSSHKETDPEDYAITMSWVFVKKNLKSPSTAEFGRISEYTLYALEGEGWEHAYEVRGPVDSQNGFGAMIRSQYISQLQYLGEDNWSLIDLRFE